MKSLAFPAFFPRKMKRTLYICLIFRSFFIFFFFWIAPEKRPDWTLSIPLCSPLCRYLCICPSLCSSPWLALTHWSASGWKNRGTPLWVCYRRWREGDRRNGKGETEERKRGRQRGRGLVKERNGTDAAEQKVDPGKDVMRKKPKILLVCLNSFILYN